MTESFDAHPYTSATVYSAIPMPMKLKTLLMKVLDKSKERLSTQSVAGIHSEPRSLSATTNAVRQKKKSKINIPPRHNHSSIFEGQFHRIVPPPCTLAIMRPNPQHREFLIKVAIDERQ